MHGWHAIPCPFQNHLQGCWVLATILHVCQWGVKACKMAALLGMPFQGRNSQQPQRLPAYVPTSPWI